MLSNKSTQICNVTGKVSYSREEAGRIINGCKRHHTASHIYRGNNIPKRAYKCEYCGRYHTTHLKQIPEFGYRKHPLKVIYGKGYSGEYDNYNFTNLVA